jgi:hypothetical protein
LREAKLCPAAGSLGKLKRDEGIVPGGQPRERHACTMRRAGASSSVRPVMKMRPRNSPGAYRVVYFVDYFRVQENLVVTGSSF